MAHFEATGSRSLLNVAIKNANLLCQVFGPGKPYLLNHPEVELGLLKLYRATGDLRYLALAKGFLEDRGRGPGRERQGTDAQDHQPLAEQRTAVGHAVCAFYTYTAMTDLAALTDCPEYLRATEQIWENIVSRKLHLIGGTGARGEGFSADYDLPNQEAKCETCAAMAAVLWNHRMFLLHGDAKYIDVLERTLYNTAAASVSLSGDRFFYANPMLHDGKAAFNMGSAEREPWLGSACCPTFAVRFLPLVGGLAYATCEDNLYINLYLGGCARVRIGDQMVEVRQVTDYPWDGNVRIKVSPEQPAELSVHLRVPCWAQGRPVPSDLYRYLDPKDEPLVLQVNGQATAVELEKGYACLRRRWNKGDLIELSLPMPVRRVVSHEAVQENTGRVALERGPVVYCMEGCDHGGNALHVSLPDAAVIRTDHRRGFLGGVTVLHAAAWAGQTTGDGSVPASTQELLAVPYCVWANRGAGEMVVWLQRTRPAN